MAQLRANHPARIAREAEKAEKAYWHELDQKCFDRGEKPGCTAISQYAGIEPQTIRLNRSGKTRLQLTTLQTLVKNLSPDIRIVLKFLGYTDSQIKAFVKEVATQ